MRQRMTDPITWEPPLDPPVDALETLSDKVEAFFEKRGYSPENIDDIAWALHEMRLFIEPESGDVDLTDDELECILAEIKPGLDEYFDDTEAAA